MVDGTLTPRFFAVPRTPPRTLVIAPRLASWDAAGHPAQQRLAAYLDHAEDLLAPALRAREGEAAVRLDVGLGDAVDLLDQRDLDNYLFPLASRVRRAFGDRVVSWWATKSASASSLLRVAPATSAPAPVGVVADITTSASAESAAFKHEVRNGVAGLPVLPDGPVWLEVAFVVGPRRNWLNLWKATIDALDPLLGAAVPGRLWHPEDGRIVRLGLHLSTDRAPGADGAIRWCRRGR